MPHPPRDLSTPASGAEAVRRRTVARTGADPSVEAGDAEVRARNRARDTAVAEGVAPGCVNGWAGPGTHGDGAGAGGGDGRGGRGKADGTGKRGEDKDSGRKRASGSGSAGAALDVKQDEARRGRSPLLGALSLGEFNLPRRVQIQFAPLHIPPHRRWQTAAVAFWALMLPLCVIAFCLLASLPLLWPLLIPYAVWVVFDKAPERGGRPREWARRSRIWKYFADYYPCSIVKEAELPPDRPYLFGYHPHGIIGMGAFATFATEGSKFSKYFPGIKPHLLTLDSNFRIPFYRDILMLHGCASVSRRACATILSQGAGTAIAIVIGGAAESLAAHPGTNDLTLKKRFGFIKMAIREGADLVPVFSFGENDIYDQLANQPGSTTYKIQKKFMKLFGFTLPLFHGRGLFNYNYGLMPFRHPIVTVIGSPIHVERDPNPTDETVQAMQKLYIDELLRIWDKYKDIYAKNRTRELTIVE
ncbi:diacylglycerol O-acyltransferase 1 [Cryptotrichosporon argae]